MPSATTSRPWICPRRLGSRDAEAAWHINLGELHVWQGNFLVSEEHGAAAVEVVPSGRVTLRMTAEGQLAIALLQQGRQAEAEDFLVRLLDEDLHAYPNHQNQALWREMLGQIREEQGRTDEAETLYTAGLAAAERLGNPNHRGRLLTRLGTLERDVDKARAAFEEAETLVRHMPIIYGYVLSLRAAHELHRGDREAAERSLARARGTIENVDFEPHALIVQSIARCEQQL